jgi:hypothetical protein|tara:strand:- start:635 stop:784 length:150 start_codon:yes stop_codon:yes gene_type:complete
MAFINQHIATIVSLLIVLHSLVKALLKVMSDLSGKCLSSYFAASVAQVE